jgi:hypothetical protein
MRFVALVPSQYSTIQAAIDAVTDGATVRVAAGTYVEAVNLRGRKIRLESETPGLAVIRAPEGARCVTASTNENANSIVSGFRFQRAGSTGGGVSVVGASPRFENCSFESCRNVTGGGALLQGGAPVFDGCTFDGCVATGPQSNLLYGAGGAVRTISGANVTLSNCTFTNCLGPYNANICMNEDGSTTTIRSCRLSGTPQGTASEIYNASGTINITDSSFTGFTGGPVLFGWSPYTVERCSFDSVTGSRVMEIRFGQTMLRSCTFSHCRTLGALFGVVYSGTYALQSCDFCDVSTPYFQGAWSDLGGNRFNYCLNPTLKLLSNAAACTPIGSTIEVKATLENCNPIVAGQMLLSWDPAKLSLASVLAGDSPFSVAYALNQSAGVVTVLASLPAGSTPLSVPSKVVARMNFTVTASTCSGTGNEVGFLSMGQMSTQFTDGSGVAITPALTGSTGFVVDDGAPVISSVPANQYAQAQAGEGGFAILSIGRPTVTDACAPGLTATGTRSDGRALNAAWPSGTTTVTWSATDPCGNVSLAYTTVTVNPTNTMDFQVAWSGAGFSGSMSRSLSLTMFGGLGTQSRTATANASNGNAAFSVTDLPVDTYTCATIEDSARTLRRRVSVSDAGVNWSATGALMSGDIINDEVIDVLDWGAYVVRNANADLNGDGEINTTDGDLILANFGLRGDSVCGGSFTEPPAPRTEISVSDLVAMGLPELAGADLNGDGWVDGRDMDMFQN